MTSPEVTEAVNGNGTDSAKPAISKASNIRNKFENNQIDKPGKTKRPTKVKYAGLASVKNRLMEDVEKINAPKDEKERGIRQITPPRNGVSCGVLESEPQARAPGVVSADDDPRDDISALAEYTKNLKAKFKQMESGEQQDEIKKAINAIEEFEAEAVRARRTIWKDIESGKMVTGQVERKKINVKEGEGNAGVFENDPEVNPDVVRYSHGAKDVVPVTSAKEKLEIFLNHSDLQNVRKINPADELKLLAEMEKNSVHENKPAERSQDVVASDGSLLEDYKTLSTARSTREKFADGSIFQQGEIKKTVIEIANDSGGVYENEPSRRPDVVRYDDSPEKDHGKWASEAKKRLLEQQAQIEEQKNKVTDFNGGGKFTTEAREKILQKQKELEEMEKNKPAPKIIDIWSEMPVCSGVFENQPAERAKDIVVCGQSSDEEDEQPIPASQ